MRTSWYVLKGFLVGLVFAWGLVCPALAQNEDGIDIVFIVDQSGSMGGEAYGQLDRTPTDPLDLRFSSVQYAVELLGSYRQAIGSDLTIRMAVVSFGSSAEISLNWTEIAPADDPNWDTTLLNLQSQLSAETFKATFPPGNLGVTDFLSAFKRADQLFDSLQETNRQRVVIVITDGAPCVDTGINAFPCGNSAGEQNHMNQLLTLTQQEFASGDYLLYAIALDSTENFWSRRQSDWEQIVRDTSHATRVENSPQIAVRIQNILTEVVASVRGGRSFIPPQSLGVSVAENIVTNGSGTATVQQIAVTPYQSELRLTFFKLEDSPIQVVVTTPDGRLLSENSVEVRIQNANQPIELWTIADPIPGEWTINILNTDYLIDAFWQMQPMSLRFETVPVAAELFETVSVTTRLVRDDGLPLPVYPLPYTLQVSANLEQATGDVVSLSLSGFGGDSFTGSFVADHVGTYTLKLSASTQTLDGEPIVLSEDSQSFNVGDFVFAADVLPEGEYLEGEIVSGKTSLTTLTGEPFHLPNLRIRAILEGQSGTIDKTQELVEDGTTGTYPYAITLPQAGTYRLRIMAISQPEGMDEQPLGSLVSPTFSVLPSVQIQLNLLKPSPGSTHYVTTGFPGFTPVRLDIEFETVSLPENTRLDLRTLGSATVVGFNIELSQDGTVVAESEAVDFTSDGIYRLSFSDLPTGNYQLSIRVTEPLGGRYILLNGGELTTTITLETHPEQIVFQRVVGIGIVALIALVIISVVLWRRRRQHPLRGTLVLKRQTGFDDPVAVKELRFEQYNTNRLKLSASSLSLRKSDVIKRIVFSCDDDRMSQRKQVSVHVQMKSGKTVEFRLSPGEMYGINTEQSYTGEEDAQPIYYLSMNLDNSFGDNETDFF